MSPSNTEGTTPFRLPQPCLMLVTDRTLAPDLVGVVAAALPHIDAVQLREKSLPASGRDLSPEDLLRLARQLRTITAGRVLFLVNESASGGDVALACGADGVHLPEAARPIERPRPDFLLGRSVHSLDAALHAEVEGVDYLIAGPVYETRSHPGSPAAGLRLIEEITRAVRVPVLAIGGIAAANVADVMRAGASGVAVISALLASPDLAGAARDLRRALDAAWAQAQAWRR